MEQNKDVPCGCSQRITDLLRAAPRKKSSLTKVTCSRCGKEFWSNVEKDYCFDCEVELRIRS